MFSGNEEPKLDWMYKGPNALVDREAYLLGRTVDKSLEQLNEEEKNKSANHLLNTAKNHVEHECIPPSIRDYNKIVKSEQVDLQAKLQEDPLVTIKRQEEETRKQFLQNPIQLKKLQDALLAQVEKKKKHKKHSKLDKKLRKKLKLLNKHLLGKGDKQNLEIFERKTSEEDEKILDTILMHKFNSLKTKLSDDDLQNILLGRFSDSEESEEDSKSRRDYGKSESRKVAHSSKRSHDNSSSDSDNYKKRKNNISEHENRFQKRNYQDKKDSDYSKDKQKSRYDNTKKNEKNKLSEEEKEMLRKSMMQKAVERTEENKKSYKKYKEEKSKPEKISDYNKEFIRKELLKSANSSSVADRIKANINNIQRSKSSMESSFLK